jgi:hypothetical protein
MVQYSRGRPRKYSNVNSLPHRLQTLRIAYSPNNFLTIIIADSHTESEQQNPAKAPA